MILRHKTINDIISSHPGACVVLRRRKIDFYRIGHLAVWEAAARQHIDIDSLIRELSTLPFKPSFYPKDTEALIRYIDERYRTHLRSLLRASIRLARSIEDQRADHDECPLGLKKRLIELNDVLARHQDKERDHLYPAMLADAAQGLRFPILRAMAEHDDISDQLDTIAYLTRDFVAPRNGGETWEVLYANCSLLDAELRLHMHLENNLLYARFLPGSAMAG